MNDMNPRSTARILGHPIHPMLVPFPIAFLVGALLSDIAFWRGGDLFWATASVYLLGAAIAMALLAALAGLTDFIGDSRIRAKRPAWLHLIGNVTIVLLSIVNLLMRLEDPAVHIVPVGLAISAIVAVLLLFTGWLGGELVFRGRVGVADPAA